MNFDADTMPFLGSCCCCGQSGPTVRSIIMLDKKSPVVGHGWGCVVCNLPADGACYVQCDACFDAKREPVFACRGYPAVDGRCPMEELTEPFIHDVAAHRAIEARLYSRESP
jgi:hypothetical protein